MLLNDLTTTTTTIEIFRNEQSSPPAVEWYQIPPGPLTPTEAEELIAISGPPYEQKQR